MLGLYSFAQRKSSNFFSQMKTRGVRLRELRDSMGLTIQELAEIIGVSTGTISQLENDLTEPKFETIAGYVKNTRINPYVFFSEPNEEVSLTRSTTGEFDEITKRILQLLDNLDEDNKRNFLKHLEEKELLKLLMTKFKKKKEAT